MECRGARDLFAQECILARIPLVETSACQLESAVASAVASAGLDQEALAHRLVVPSQVELAQVVLAQEVPAQASLQLGLRTQLAQDLRASLARPSTIYY